MEYCRFEPLDERLFGKNMFLGFIKDDYDAFYSHALCHANHWDNDEPHMEMIGSFGSLTHDNLFDENRYVGVLELVDNGDCIVYASESGIVESIVFNELKTQFARLNSYEVGNYRHRTDFYQRATTLFDTDSDFDAVLTSENPSTKEYIGVISRNNRNLYDLRAWRRQQVRHLSTVYNTFIRSNFVSCDLCGTPLSNEADVLNCVRIGDDESVTHMCDSCRQNIEQCTVCGRYRMRDAMVRVNYNERICADCFEQTRSDWIECDECHGMYSEDDMRMIGRADNGAVVTAICNICYDNISSSDLMHSWNYKPDRYNFLHGDAKQRHSEERGKRYIGVEIEMDKGDRNGFMRGCHMDAIVNGYGNMFYFMHDGSLENGVEVTTMPIELDYALNGYPFDFIHEQAVKYGMRSHDTKTCGLHLHINKLSIGSKNNTSFDLVIAKLLLLFDKFYDELCYFGRRLNKKSAHRWADKPNAYIEKRDTSRDVTDKIERSAYNHYKAVNMSPSFTVEIRLWKGTHNPNTIRATIDFTSAMLDMCENCALSTIYDMDWDTFVAYTLKYTKLDITKDYLRKRKLLAEKED